MELWYTLERWSKKTGILYHMPQHIRPLPEIPSILLRPASVSNLVRRLECCASRLTLKDCTVALKADINNAERMSTRSFSKRRNYGLSIPQSNKTGLAVDSMQNSERMNESLSMSSLKYTTLSVALIMPSSRVSNADASCLHVSPSHAKELSRRRRQLRKLPTSLDLAMHT
jgi:3-dehydroquinate dehydratase